MSSIDDSVSPVLTSTPLRLQTKLAFAFVTALGGMLLGTGADTGPLAVVVVAFALIGFVCVDWLQLFALPGLIAYAAMALTAVICILDFAQDSFVLAPKMAAVAQLLAIAQAILMLQEKTHRLFEQLLTFALLNCIVAAVFNDAFSYVVWFLPLTIVSGIALTLLSADESVTRIGETGREPAGSPIQGMSRYDNRAAIASFSRVSSSLSWASVVLLLPAVLAVATVIFFALPRRVEAQRNIAAEAMTGFSETVELGKIGRMQQSRDRVLRVKLEDPGDEDPWDSRQPYPVIGGLYLRGIVLEQYISRSQEGEGARVGSWQSRPVGMEDRPRQLPPRYIPPRASDRNFYDRVHVDIRCEAMRTAALFAIAPYHRIIGSEGVLQNSDQWTFTRNIRGPSSTAVRFERIEYRFGTQSFRNGAQSQWIHDLSLAPIVGRGRFQVNALRNFGEEFMSDTGPPVDHDALTGQQRQYLDALLNYPADAIPSARSVAEEVVDTIAARRRNPFEIAKRLEEHLSQHERYDYTLNLDQEIVAGMDPLEQFLSVDRRGHCQYFASALAMMLRSQGIPARIVVGYHGDEFNSLGQYYIFRQSHAHAWVEALIDREDIPLSQTVYGQPVSQRYWLRLDPTPGGGGVPDGGSNANGGGRRIAELAKNFWNDYIIEMNHQRQDSALSTTPGLTPITNSYRSWIERAKRFALRINSDDIELPGKKRTIYILATIAAMVLLSAAAVFMRRQYPDVFKRRKNSETQPVARPSISFYSETLDLLARAGYARSAGQTPAELTGTLPDERIRNPAAALTQIFYRWRYGAEDAEEDAAGQETVQLSLASLREGLERPKTSQGN